ncbi:MAG: hypothetical protein RMX96_02080 [Nostoc sp. ChiSLP02]|nr:hypothetical protein [Nostoc sp. DedSLP05]MDZ8098750.1 hypothetical protein [Nostoc sp. DedSLP01]MDZ8183637.1 hypothetical protein [Nostoc sp. ChiSLP02]
MRLIVYLNYGIGFGNISRMLQTCTSLLDLIAKVPILVFSDLPMLQRFQLPKSLDYIRTPYLNRGTSAEMSAKYLQRKICVTVRLGSELILSAIAATRTVYSTG